MPDTKPDDLVIKSFKTPADFRAWLEKNHHESPGLWIRYFKKASNKESIVYKQALDEALCWGWIDGLVRSIDADCYMQRWTPRRARSIWSDVNTKKVARLTAEGRMQPAGLAAFARRDAKRSGVYSYERAKKTP